MIRTKKILKSIRKTDYNWDEIAAEKDDHQSTKSEKKKKKTSASQSHKTHRWKANSMLYFIITF